MFGEVPRLVYFQGAVSLPQLPQVVQVGYTSARKLPTQAHMPPLKDGRPTLPLPSLATVA